MYVNSTTLSYYNRTVCLLHKINLKIFSPEMFQNENGKSVLVKNQIVIISFSLHYIHMSGCRKVLALMNFLKSDQISEINGGGGGGMGFSVWPRNFQHSLYIIFSFFFQLLTKEAFFKTLKIKAKIVIGLHVLHPFVQDIPKSS